MSFSATFYTFQKRINSTKQPTGGSSYNIILKEGCSVNHPTIALDMGLASSPAALNYCYITEFGRYYWVKWRFEDRLWIGECNVDPLASFKTQIGSSNCYVARSASSYDTHIVDTFYPALAKNTHDAQSATSPFTTDVENGSYIIGIQGKGSGGNGGAVTYYKATSSGMKALVNYLLSSPSSYQVSDISEELLMCIFNPLQYIVSCMWFPFSVPTMGGDCDVGWWNANISGVSRLSTLEWGTNLSFTIPKHPKQSRGSYLNLPPFSRYRMQAGPWGTFPLDGFNLLDSSSLTCLWRVDLITGSGRYCIQFRDKLAYESEISAQIGVPIQLGQNLFNQGALVNTTSSAIDTVKSALMGDPSGMLANGITAIGNAAALTQAVPSTLGSNGTLSFNNSFAILADFLDIADEDIQSRGRPLCQAKTISSLSGYVQCFDADPAVSCSDEELSMIVQYMNNGFFYE